MIARTFVACACALACVAPLAASAQTPPSPVPEVITAIQVHGNTATPDDDIRTMAGVAIGAVLQPGTLDDVSTRLRATKRFERVEVLKRFASIADPSQIMIVIIVDEGPVHIDMTGDADHPTRVARNHGPRLLFLPVLFWEDGYGATYGGEFARPNPIGPNSRLSFTGTWGGEKLAGAELDKRFTDAPITRIVAGGSVSKRENPYYEQDMDREGVDVTIEREIVHSLRVHGVASWQHVTFDALNDDYAEFGADVVLDTRLDPVLARNAVYAKASWSHLTLGPNRSEIDARGYLGLLGQSVLAVRAQRLGADAPLPLYLKPLFGGTANVRGFAAGSSAGDNLVAVSGELILPLTSPLSIGRLGVSAFTDAGTVYDWSQRLADQTFSQGYGGSVWFAATFLRLNIAVAHGRGSSTRVQIGGNVTF
jgi:outer membrane protein assembly factor BamA